ncbi:MAG: copper chaperone PCu(A)C [Azospirillaceae bacterium]
MHRLVTGLAIAALAVITAAVAPSAQETGAIAVEAPWTRATPPGAPTAAGFLVLRNTGESEDRLVGARSPAAGTVEVHEMAMEDGVMRMRHLTDGLAVPPGGSVTLEPGGYHLMFMDLAAPFEAGGTVTVTLEFERAGERAVTLPVAPIGAREAPAE